MRSLSRPDRGDGPITAAILLPGVLAVGMLLVQAGLYFHASNVASAAAQVGAERSRSVGATASQGQQAATGYAQQVAPALADGLTVQSARDGATATVRVELTAPALVPGIPLPRVAGQSSMPVERLSDR